MSDNPYAPSTADPVTEAPRSYGWKISGGKLMIERDALLPMIDPYSGETAERMTMIKVAVKRRIWWPALLFFAGIWLWVDHPAIGIPLLFAGTIPAFVGEATLRIFITDRTMKRQRRDRRLATGGLLLMVGGILILMRPSLDPRLSGLLSYIGAFLLVIALVLGWRQRRLSHIGRKDGWFKIAGIHPQALAELERDQASCPEPIKVPAP